jgi:hypothetical protein
LHPTLGRMVLMIQRDAQKTGVSRSYSTHDNPLFGLHPVPVDADERIRTSAWRTQSLMLAVALMDYRMTTEGHFRAALTAWASARPARRDCAMM